MSFTNKSTKKPTLDDCFLNKHDRSLEFIMGSWDKRFSEIVLPSINEERFTVLFNEEKNLEQNCPINVIIGALILKELLNLTEDELLDAVLYDSKFQDALHITSSNKLLFNEQTFGLFRKKIYYDCQKTGRDLLYEEMESIAKVFHEFLNILPTQYWIESIIISSKCKLMSQLEVIYNCTSILAREIYHLDKTYISNEFSHYLENEDYNLTIKKLKSDEVQMRVRQVCVDANHLIKQIQETKVDIQIFQQLLSIIIGLLEQINGSVSNETKIDTFVYDNLRMFYKDTTFKRELTKKKYDFVNNDDKAVYNSDSEVLNSNKKNSCDNTNNIAEKNTEKTGEVEEFEILSHNRAETNTTSAISNEKKTILYYSDFDDDFKRIHSSVKIKKHNAKAKMICLVMLIVFLGETIFGLYLSFGLGIMLNDAISRTANAFYVLFVSPPRFASIGLIWSPLPSAIQIPFMYLAKLWRPIASKGISGIITTASFAAASIGIILYTFIKLDISKKIALIIVFLYAVNPFIFFYGSNGMSETSSYFFIVYSICSFTLWMKFSSTIYMTHMGFAIAALFLTRYEAIPFALAIGIGVVLNIIFNPEEDRYTLKRDRKERYFYIEGSMVLIFLPLIYVALLWILFNYVISGDPFYFIESIYSSAAQSEFVAVQGSVIYKTYYLLARSIPFLPIFISITLIRIKEKKVFRYDFLVLTILILAMLSLQYLMLIKGNSFGVLRYFSYSLPICIAWIPYEISDCKKRNLTYSKIVIILGLILSSFLCFYALSDKELGKEEQTVRISNESYIIADYINNEIADERILFDAFTLSAVVLNIEHTENLIITSSPNFYDYVKDPINNEVRYILVPNPSGVGNLDAINTAYPGLYENGAEWCNEIKDFDGYKLFEIIN